MKQIKLTFLALMLMACSRSTAADIEPYRASIMDLYNTALADPNTSWLTKLWLRNFPPKVVAAAQPCFSMGALTGPRTIELNLEALAKVPETTVNQITAHEFAHYKHADGIRAGIVALPTTIAVFGAAILTHCYIDGSIVQLQQCCRAHYKDENRLKRYAAHCASSLLSVARYAVPAAAGLGTYISCLRLWSHHVELQADAAAVRSTKNFADGISKWLTTPASVQSPAPKIVELLFRLVYPSRMTFARNIANVAAQEKLQELIAQNPSISHDTLSTKAQQWAENLLQSAMQKATAAQ